MLYDYTAFKRSLECLFGLGALGKINPSTGSHHQELMCHPLGMKLDVKTTCGDWYTPIWFRTKKRYQIPGNVLGLHW
ncbi:hypothetical protein TNCV_2119831 [Trichonephila clavipes]|nr:hypothetical protein TNCV_2119831 [Trichonephila clavipes]